MSIQYAIEDSLHRYLRAKVEPQIYSVSSWSQQHPGGCFGAEKCKCYQTAEVHVEYVTVGHPSSRTRETWVFEGTISALIKMLDAFDDMEPE